MNLIISAGLTEPPSEVAVFRDVTLYSSSFLKMIVLLHCQRQMQDLYWYWLKSFGAFDFVEDIINETDDEPGITIGTSKATIVVKHLRAENLNYVVSRLISLK